MRKQRRARSREQEPTGLRFFLRVFDLLRVPIGWTGVDYRHFRALIELRLRIDLRPSKNHAGGFGGKGLLLTAGLYLFMGALPGLMLLMLEEAFWGEALAQGITMMFLTLGMVVEFSSAFFDPADESLVLPAPISDRTLLVARIAHVCTYLSVLLCALMLGPLVCGSIVFPFWLWIPLHVLCSVLCAALCVFFVVMIYMLTLRTFGIERFKSVATWIQMGLIGVLYGGLYVLQPIVREHVDEEFFLERSLWLLAIPPTWFGGLYDVLSGSAHDPVTLGLAALAVLVPTVLLWAALRFSRSRFLLSLSSSNGAAIVSERQGLFARMGDRVTAPGLERAGFHFFRALASREHRFRMQVWPMLAMLAAMGLGNLLRAQTHDPFFWSLGIYVAIVFLPVLIESARYGESSDARWVFNAAPLLDHGLFVVGAIKAILCGIVIVPGLAYIVLLTVLFQLDGLMHGLIAFELVLIGALLFLPAFLRYLPFSEPFKMSRSSGSVFIFMLGMVALVLLAAGQYVLTLLDAVAYGAIPLFGFVILALWTSLRRLKRTLRLAL